MANLKYIHKRTGALVFLNNYLSLFVYGIMAPIPDDHMTVESLGAPRVDNGIT